MVGPSTAGTATGRGKSLYLARIPENKIQQGGDIEFFGGHGRWGKPAWTRNFKEANAIFTDANGVSPGTITYDHGLKRYLLSCFHTGPGQLGIFEATEPWGPWHTVAYYESWGDMAAAGEGLDCEFPSKWISGDGLSLWCVFAVYGEGGKTGIKAHDKFNLVNVTFTRR
jgi:hypothetical protein